MIQPIFFSFYLKTANKQKNPQPLQSLKPSAGAHGTASPESCPAVQRPGDLTVHTACRWDSWFPYVSLHTVADEASVRADHAEVCSDHLCLFSPSCCEGGHLQTSHSAMFAEALASGSGRRHRGKCDWTDRPVFMGGRRSRRCGQTCICGQTEAHILPDCRPAVAQPPGKWG